MEKYFWFIKEVNYDVYLADTLQAVMCTHNGPEYMKTTKFAITDIIVVDIVKNMNIKHNKKVLNILFKFIEKVYKKGYTVSKNKYIKQKRKDIMKAIEIIEEMWIKFKVNKNRLEMSMDFTDLHLH